MKTRAVQIFPRVFAVFGFLASADIGRGSPPLEEQPPPDYGSWETDNGITGAGATADSDGDGISNGIELVIGGDPSSPGSDSNSLLPTITVDVEHMNITFRRTDASVQYDPLVEYSGLLGQWIMAEPGVDGVFIEEEGDFFGPGVARVIVRIPRNLASGHALFARLVVDIPP